RENDFHPLHRSVRADAAARVQVDPLLAVARADLTPAGVPVDGAGPKLSGEVLDACPSVVPHSHSSVDDGAGAEALGQPLHSGEPGRWDDGTHLAARKGRFDLEDVPGFD